MELFQKAIANDPSNASALRVASTSSSHAGDEGARAGRSDEDCREGDESECAGRPAHSVEGDDERERKPESETETEPEPATEPV